MARWEREGVVVDCPDGMDYLTLERIVGNILAKAEEALRSKPPRKEPRPPELGGFWRVYDKQRPKKT
jgi:hypothetical protein